MGKGGGFKKRNKPKKKIKSCRESYINWRMCQGFTEAEAGILFGNLDGFRDELNEPIVYLETLAKYNEMFSKGTQTIAKATTRIWDRYQSDASTYIQHINRLTTIMNLVSVGNYDAATVLLRSSIEAFLRSNMLFVNALSTNNMIPNVNHDEEWERAISDDPKVAMSIGNMCRMISRLGYNGKIRSPYHFMKIDYLNEITHSNINTIKKGDDNVLTTLSTKKEFNEIACDKFVKVFLRFVEFQIVFWQCLIDEFDPQIEPVIIFRFETPADDKTFPRYQKILENRFVEEFAEYFRLVNLHGFNTRLPTMKNLIEERTETGWSEGWWNL
jgi:hypothetical protein